MEKDFKLGGLYIHDLFCDVYWNLELQAWQKNLTKQCIAQSIEALSARWHGYVRDEDIVIKHFSQLALAA